MPAGRLYSLVLSAFLLALSTTVAAETPEQKADEAQMMAAAGLSPVLPKDGDIVRYVISGYQYHRDRPRPRNDWRKVRIVQVHWPFKSEHPHVLLLDLVKPPGGWEVAKRREELMGASRYPRLISNLLAAASATAPHPDRGITTICSHAESSRLEISLPDQQLQLTRTAHCSPDAPAVIAGELLMAAVELSLEIDRPPRDRAQKQADDSSSP